MESEAKQIQWHEAEHFIPDADAVPPISRRRLVFKRIGDLICAMAAAMVLFLPMVVIAVMIKLDSPGPVLYQQQRLGKNAKPFTLYKFRSMRVDAEQDGPRWAEENDARCTRLGRLLRRTRLDEIPQLINIVRGDMSFVGPRPERLYFYNQFEAHIPNFRNRLAVTPGLTGHAQVNGGYGLGPEEKIVYDMEYIRTQSGVVDLRCMVKTVVVVLTGKGAR